MNKYKPISPEQMAALRAFADYAGRTWKQKLRDAWLNASIPGYLHQLRNTHGPTWLDQFQFPKGTP